MDVGVILLWPWKKPRYDEMTQTKNTAGARAAMAAQELGDLINSASWRQNSSMPPVPTMPMVRKTYSDAR